MDQQNELFEQYCEYQRYLLQKEEWCSYASNDRKGTEVLLSEPLLIAEINRLIPFVDKARINFHPVNMPHVKLGRIDVVGFVTSVRETPLYYEYTIEDGTGVLPILYKKQIHAHQQAKRADIDNTFQKYAKDIRSHLPRFDQNFPKNFPKTRPQFKYPRDTPVEHIVILEQAWWNSVQEGMLGKKPDRLDYVHVIGFCKLSFVYGTRPKDDFTFNHLSASHVNFFATRMNCISERIYNSMLLGWLENYISKRYNINDAQSNQEQAS